MWLYCWKSTQTAIAEFTIFLNTSLICSFVKLLKYWHIMFDIVRTSFWINQIYKYSKKLSCATCLWSLRIDCDGVVMLSVHLAGSEPSMYTWYPGIILICGPCNNIFLPNYFQKKMHMWFFPANSLFDSTWINEVYGGGACS